MEGSARAGILDSDNFKGYGCAFCGVTIPPADITQLPISILAGGRTFRFWVHRTCLAVQVQPLTRLMLEKVPLASLDELRATRLRIIS